MTTNSSRPNLTGIAAACILSGGLITAAIIDSHKQVTLPGVAPASIAALSAPPIAQESARQQVHDEILGSPKFHNMKMGEGSSTLTGVNVTEVTYSAKDDSFYVYCDLTWQSLGKDKPLSRGGANLTNDGYGHYEGTINVDEGPSQREHTVDVTVK